MTVGTSLVSAAQAQVVIAVLGVLVIPLVVIAIRGAVKWTNTEASLRALVKDVRKLTEDQDKTHAAILDQMKYDRDATNSRLRYLEEMVMRAAVEMSAEQRAQLLKDKGKT